MYTKTGKEEVLKLMRILAKLHVAKPLKQKDRSANCACCCAFVAELGRCISAFIRTLGDSMAVQQQVD